MDIIGGLLFCFPPFVKFSVFKGDFNVFVYVFFCLFIPVGNAQFFLLCYITKKCVRERKRKKSK